MKRIAFIFGIALLLGSCGQKQQTNTNEDSIKYAAILSDFEKELSVDEPSFNTISYQSDDEQSMINREVVKMLAIDRLYDCYASYCGGRLSCRRVDA